MGIQTSHKLLIPEAKPCAPQNLIWVRQTPLAITIPRVPALSNFSESDFALGILEV
jgi:hypothetical protein